VTIPKNNIQNRATGLSMMPSGLVDSLTSNERLDLFRFLSELGKPGPFDASKGNVAPAWELFPPTPPTSPFGDQKILRTDLTNNSWTPVRSLVDGRLLKEELAAPLKEVESRNPEAVFAAARFQLASSGPASFKLTGADGCTAWIDDKLVQIN